MTRIPRGFLVAASLAIAAPVAGAKLPDTWEGLYRVKAKGLDGVYLRPAADFRAYIKVVLGPTLVAFRKDWRRDQNDNAMGFGRQVSDADARRILDSAQADFEKLLREAYARAGYQVVTAAAPDVLRIETAIVDLDVSAPDIETAARTRVYTRDAGGATLVVEARDSVSGALLGRALDAESAEMGIYRRDSVTNAAAFETLFARWAKQSAEGLGKLKALSPIDANAMSARK